MPPGADGAEPYRDPMTETDRIEPETVSSHHVEITTSTAPFATEVIAGVGDASNVQNFYNGYSFVRTEEISDTQVAEAKYAFIQPQWYGRAWHTLSTNNVLVICGPRDIGKRTAAISLLAKLQTSHADRRHNTPEHPVHGLRELAKDWESPTVAALPLFPRQGLLLDLSDSEDQAPKAEFGSRLVDYALKLAAVRSFLIIVATPEVWSACAGSTVQLTEKDLDYPTAAAIIEARLTHPTSPCPQRTRWLVESPFVEVVDHGLLPHDAVTLAEAIAAAADSPTGKADAVDQLHGWRSYLKKWWGKTDDEPQDRAMQVVMATVGKATAADVLLLTDSFLAAANHKKEIHRPLAGPDLSERLRRTGAVVADDGFVALEPNRPQFADAALDHMWRERPQLQEHYMQWVAQVTKTGQVGKKYVERIAHSVTGIGIRRKAVEFLELIEAWTKTGGDQDGLATRMLEDTCLDRAVGAQVRKRLRQWTENQTTPVRLINIVIAVCQGELGIDRTVVALTRLKKILTRAQAAEFTDAVGAAIAAIADHPDRLPIVLSEITGWIGEADPLPGRVGFLALMGTDGDALVLRRLLVQCREDDQVRRTITEAWHTLVNTGPLDDGVVDGIKQLLGFANRSREFMDVVVSILDPAIRGNFKMSIAGKVLVKSMGNDADDSDATAHEKLFKVLFDEPTPVRADPEEDTRPASAEDAPVWESVEVVEPSSMPPREEAPSPPVTSDRESTAGELDEVAADGDGAPAVVSDPSPPVAETPVYPQMQQDPPPDDPPSEKRGLGWLRR